MENAEGPDLIKKDIFGSGEWFNAFFHSSPAGVALSDAAGELISINTAGLRILGVPDNRIRSPFRLFDHFLLPDTAKGSLEKGETIRYESGFDFEMVKRARHFETEKTGTIFLDMVITPVQSKGSSAPLGYIVQFLDVTGQKAAAEHAHHLKNMLTLVGSVTRHDVLNQLTAIAGYNDLLSMMTEDQKLTAFLAKEKKAIEKIRLLFQYSKEYQNLGAEPPRWQMLRNVIARMSEEADTTSFRIQDLTKNASVCADPLFERVFYHLFNNAGQHGDRVSEVRISLCETTSGALLIIEDDGAGILAGDKQKIFDRGQGKNTGWGLFLVREILSQSGMTIAETGEPGKGARFEIRIPFGKYRFF